MSFVLKNEDGTTVDNLFSFHNGFTGEFYVVKFILESKDNVSYDGVQLRLASGNGFDAWSGKLASGHTLLSEEEWNTKSNILDVASFGTSQSLSCRVYCPGGTTSNIYQPFNLIVENAND